MNTQVIKKEDTTIIYLEGRLDTTNSASFKVMLQDYMNEDGINILIDLSKLSYISSSGLRCFIMLLKSVTSNNGTLALANITPDILEIFKITGLSKIFTIKS